MTKILGCLLGLLLLPLSVQAAPKDQCPAQLQAAKLQDTVKKPDVPKE